MRFAIVRAWAATAAAILAAAAADACTELAGNSGWLGGGPRDAQQEAIVPALLTGAALAVFLLVFVLLARVSPSDPLLLRMTNLRSRLADIAAAFGGSVACIVVMEGYETRFGGLSPFDARSIVLTHTLPLLLAFVIMGALVHCALRAALRAAGRASGAVAEFLEEFLGKCRDVVDSASCTIMSAFELRVTHVALEIAHGSHGLRAPPRSIRPRYFMA